MDNKQKYENALERCKKEFNFNNLAYSHEEIKQKLERIFPELKESEDERIRKAIIEYLEQSQFGEEHYLIDDNVVRGYISWLEKQGEQKPTWSEEDEQMFTLCALSVKTCYNDGLLTCNEYEQASLWLKSLKDRVQLQPKQEWSADDTMYFTSVKLLVENSENLNGLLETMNSPEYIKKCLIDWLKSLKERYIWKPSDEQMEIIYKYSEQNNYDGSVLTSLYRDLKKLKG